MLSGVNGASPWAADAPDHLVEVALGRYSPGLIAEWSPPDGFDAVEAASRMLDAPHVWTDGSLVLDQVTGVSSSGAVFYAPQLEAGVNVGGVMLIVFVQMVRFRLAVVFVLSRGLLQSVQRAELWGVILAFKSSDAVHLGLTFWVWFGMF